MVKKRELERRRNQQVRMWMMIAAVAVAAGAVGAAVVLTPIIRGPQGDLGPGEIRSQSPMHIHPRLTILSDGQPRGVPSGIGLQGGTWASHALDQYLDPGEGQQGTLSPLHTHDSSGVIHVEAKVTRGFTLGEFFEVWGQPLSSSQVLDMVADSNHVLALKVDGAPSNLWKDVVFKDGENIEIDYTTV